MDKEQVLMRISVNAQRWPNKQEWPTNLGMMGTRKTMRGRTEISVVYKIKLRCCLQTNNLYSRWVQSLILISSLIAKSQTITGIEVSYGVPKSATSITARGSNH